MRTPFMSEGQVSMFFLEKMKSMRSVDGHPHTAIKICRPPSHANDLRWFTLRRVRTPLTLAAQLDYVGWESLKHIDSVLRGRPVAKQAPSFLWVIKSVASAMRKCFSGQFLRLISTRDIVNWNWFGKHPANHQILKKPIPWVSNTEKLSNAAAANSTSNGRRSWCARKSNWALPPRSSGSPE